MMPLAADTLRVELWYQFCQAHGGPLHLTAAEFTPKKKKKKIGAAVMRCTSGLFGITEGDTVSSISNDVSY